MIIDLTDDTPVVKKLLRYSLPLLVSAAFQQFYNIADSVIAGRYIGKDALAAIGASQPITSIFLAIAMGMNVGCSVVCANLFGGRRKAQLRSAITTSLLLTLLVGVTLTAAGLALSRTLMRMIDTPPELLDDATLYLSISIWGFSFVYLYNICTGIFKALGNTSMPLYFLMGSSLANVALDYIFVRFLDWGVAGVAWATFIAQGAAALLVSYVLLKRMRFELATKEPAPLFSPPLFRKIAVLSIPAILQQSSISVGDLLVQSRINRFGPDTIAGFTAGIKISRLAITCMFTMATGLVAYTAQNFGAGKQDRILEGYRAGLMIALIVSVPIIVLYQLFSEPLIRLFVDSSATAVVETGSRFLRVVSPFYCLLSIKMCTDCLVQGAGYMRGYMASTMLDLCVRVLSAFVLVYFFSTAESMSFAWCLGWIVGMSVALVVYFKGRWKTHGLVIEPTPEKADG